MEESSDTKDYYVCVIEKLTIKIQLTADQYPYRLKKKTATILKKDICCVVTHGLFVNHNMEHTTEQNTWMTRYIKYYFSQILITCIFSFRRIPLTN